MMPVRKEKSGKITKTELKKDYWFTEKMIAEMLPEPEQKRITTYRNRYALLWDFMDVYKAQQTDRYKEHVEKARIKKAKGRERAEKEKIKNLKPVYEIADRFKLFDGAPQDKETLKEWALESYNERRLEKGYNEASTINMDEDTLNRLMLNHIRHEWTNYEYLVNRSDYETAKKIGHSAFYETLLDCLNDKFLEMLESNYPYLMEAWGQYRYRKSEKTEYAYEMSGANEHNFKDNPKRIEDFYVIDE